jgi:hypothetical protein
LQFGLRLVDKFELAGGYVGVGEHNKFIYNSNVYLILLSQSLR